jgi:diphthine-ammonia ligase
MSRYALMWSGGKDSALALWRARRQGLNVDRLVNVYDHETERVCFHATTVDAIERQATVAGMRLVRAATAWET